MRSIRSRSAAVVGIVALAVATLACNDPYAHPRSRGAGATEPHRGGVFRFSSDSEPAPLDPHSEAETFTAAFTAMIFDTLVEYAPGTTDLRPGLAERWELSDDHLVYTFHLRAGVRFHNGRLLVASDVKKSFERMLNPARVACAVATFYDGIVGFDDLREKKSATLSGIAAPNDATVTYRLKQPDASFLDRFTLPNSGIVPVDVLESMGAESFGRAPVGTGEYVFDHWERGTRIVLRRNSAYWRPGKPYLDEVVCDFNVPAYLAAMQFRHGDLDTYVVDDPRWFEAHPGWLPYVRRTPAASVSGVAMNTELPPWNNVHLRRAVAFALDRDAIVRATGGLLAPSGRLLPPGIHGRTPQLANAQRFDLEQARAEMRAAGYPNGLAEEQELWVPQGGNGPQIAALIQSDLAGIGVPIRLRTASNATFSENLGRRHAVSLALAGWNLDFPDPVDFTEPLFHSKSISEENSFNSAFYSSPSLDALLDRARGEASPEARFEMYAEAERRIVDEAPWAFYGDVVAVEASQPYVRGIRTSVITSFDFRDVWLDLPTRPWETP